MLIVTLKNAVAGICNQFCLDTRGLFLQCAMGHYSFEMGSAVQFCDGC